MDLSGSAFAWAAAAAAAATAVLLFATTSGWLYYFLVGRHKLEPGKRCVVVTGCDSGFGLDMALDLTEKGFLVVALCYTKQGAARLKQQKQAGLVVVLGDVTKSSDIDQLLRATVALLKKHKTARLWAVVNNAGVAPMGQVAWVPEDTVRHCMDVNFFAVYNVVRAYLPLLKDSPGSRIINISSMAGLAGGPSFGPYCASKHALQGLTTCLREELRPWDVSVCNVNPAFMRTPMLGASIDQARRLFEAADESVRSQYDEAAVLADGNKVLLIAESPSLVVRLVVDRLIPSRAPLFNNYVGLQAGLLRLVLVLPKLWIEIGISLVAPRFRKA